MSVTDRVTVMRDGQVLKEHRIETLNEAELIESILGRRADEIRGQRASVSVAVSAPAARSPAPEEPGMSTEPQPKLARRVVTGVNDEGNSVIVSDAETATWVRRPTGTVVMDVWRADPLPAHVDDEPAQDDELVQAPAASGVCVRIAVFPPRQGRRRGKRRSLRSGAPPGDKIAWPGSTADRRHQPS
ncbi:hypothetical protein [Streptomyces sviceus]|uniref:hypothetical protein n=1 Tax=Streptomyces sviceus TaxID=285530 RepID=UPI0036AA94B1